MNNKILYIFSILIILNLSFVYADLINSATFEASTFSAYSISNWTKGGENTSFQFTLTFNTGDQYTENENDSIGNITIFVPGNVLLPNLLATNFNLTNITDANNVVLNEWSFVNKTAMNDDELWINTITFQNGSAGALNTSLNTSIIINLPVYYNETSTDETVTWRIEIANTSSMGVVTDSIEISSKVDNIAPATAVVTDDESDNRLSTGGSITFTCSSSDGGTGLKSSGYVWKVNSGGADTQITDQTDSTLTLTSSSTLMTTNKAGDYIAKCATTDLVGRVGVDGSSSAIVFTSSTGGSSSSSSGSGSSSSASFDADLSTSTTGSISGSVGRIKSFSLDGTEKHTITFKEITATSAKITIASTPIDVVLNVGESKNVDLDSNGKDDVKVTLSKITGTSAEISIEKLATASTTPTTQGETTPSGEQEETQPTEETTKGTGWIWIVLLIIVVLVTVGYYVFKKKK